MDENNLDNQNQPDQNEQDNVPMIDKILQNNPFVKMGQANYENVQTQSVVKSTREEAKEQLAAINAQQAEYARQQKRAEDALKAKRTIAYILVVIFFVAIFAVGIWVIINAISASHSAVAPEAGSESTVDTKFGKIDGYKCKSDKCAKAADINDKKIIIRDDGNFYVFNKEDKSSVLTTIPSDRDYSKITAFPWGNRSLVILDPESGQSALYDITNNSLVTDFSYDEFYADASADVYKEMTSLIDSYIIANNAGSYRLIDLASGSEKLRANKKVFVHDKFFFGYEQDGSIHVYTDGGTKIFVAASGSRLFTKNGFLIYLTDKGLPTVYDSAGAKVSNSDLVKEVNKIKAQDRIATLNNDATYYNIPANN